MIKSKVITSFKGEIEGVKFQHQGLYDTVLFVMKRLDWEYNDIVDTELVEAFSKELWHLYLKTEDYSLHDIEKEIHPTEVYAVGGDKWSDFSYTNVLINKKKKEKLTDGE